MIIFPLLLTSLQYWIFDNMLKNKNVGNDGSYISLLSTEETEEQNDEENN